MVSPCRCTGTQAYVHVHCLHQWTSYTQLSTARTRCQQCHAPYAQIPPLRRKRRPRRVPVCNVLLLLLGLLHCVGILIGSFAQSNAPVGITTYVTGGALLLIFCVAFLCAFGAVYGVAAWKSSFLPPGGRRQSTVVGLLCLAFVISSNLPSSSDNGALQGFACYLLSAAILQKQPLCVRMCGGYRRPIYASDDDDNDAVQYINFTTTT